MCSQVPYRLFMEVTYSLFPHIVAEVLPRNFLCILAQFLSTLLF
jgi:hypothetical protein